jgi:hypothetical protein
MNTPLARLLRFLLPVLLLAALTSCGGGGNSSGTSLLGGSSSGGSSSLSGASGSTSTTSSATSYAIALTSSATALSTAGNATETATVTSASGAPQAGVTVTFMIGSNSSGATLSAGASSTAGSTASISAVTNSSGQAWVTYTAGSNAGTDAVIAQATPTTSGAATAYGSVSITVSPGTASTNSETIQFVPGTSVTVAPGVQDEFEVKVLSGGTNPVVGATVQFSLASNSSGATLNGGNAPVKVTTAADGTAYVSYQAGGSSGTTDTVSASVLNSSSVALATATQQVTISASGSSKYFLALTGTTLLTPTEAVSTCASTTNPNGNSLTCSNLATDVMSPSAAVQTVDNGVTLTGTVTDSNGNPVPNMAVIFSFGSATTAGYLPYCNLTNASGTPSCTDGGKTGTSATGQVQPGYINSGGTLQNSCIAAETDNNGYVAVRYATGGVTGVDTVIASVTPGSAINPNSPQTCPSSLSTIYVTQSALMHVSLTTPQP